MEDRDEDAEVEGDLPEEENPGSEGISPQALKRTTRNGSPVPPKILYKSTTGKGVAFTQEDVQYLMDYMKYRK